MKRKQTGWNRKERNYKRPGYRGWGRNFAMVTRLKLVTMGLHWFQIEAGTFEHGKILDYNYRGWELPF